MTFGEKIKEFRTKKGMTQKALAEELNVTSQAVSRWENDEVEPSISTISQMAELFECSIDELFGKTKVEQEAKQDIKEDNIIINVNDNVKEEKEEKVQAKINIAICSCCNKPLYEQDEIKRWKRYERHGRSSTEVSDIVCEDCYNEKLAKVKQALKDKAQEKVEVFKKRRIRAIVWMSIIVILGLALMIYGLVIAKDNDARLGALVIFIVSILLSTFVGSLLLKGNFLGDVWLTVSNWGFVKFPGIIFTLDLGGIAFLIVIKVLFFFLSIGFIILFEIIATMLCMLLSVISFPIALYRNIKLISKDDDQFNDGVEIIGCNPNLNKIQEEDE